jgi:hypothetical protein
VPPVQIHMATWVLPQQGDKYCSTMGTSPCCRSEARLGREMGPHVSKGVGPFSTDWRRSLLLNREDDDLLFLLYR